MGKYDGIYKTNAQITRERIVRWMKDNPGVMAQLEWCKAHPGEAPVLTEEMLNEFIETLRFNDKKNNKRRDSISY